MSVKILHEGENTRFKSDEVVRETAFLPLKKKRTLVFERPPIIVGRRAVGGKKEGLGPIGKYLHRVYDDDKLNETTFEKAEFDMLSDAIIGSIAASGKLKEEIDALIAGDLLNQITSSSYVARELGLPYLGVYSACSTMTEALALGSMAINAGYFENVVCATASHFATAERQFRYPLEYGCQRPPYAQWTVTAAGSTVLSNDGSGAKVVAATIGRVVDYGTNDLNNMGASMAPAAADSLDALFSDTGTKPSDYDLIITGDLGKLGSDILRRLSAERGYELGRNYVDCGCLIYDVTQKCYQGGSGCGCSAAAFNSFVLDKIESGEYGRVAYFATGALMSAQSCYQGETIPCISHGVVVEK